jgi:hypothetical protein
MSFTFLIPMAIFLIAAYILKILLTKFLILPPQFH